jgi:diacylglycerol kinase family enzyme
MRLLVIINKESGSGVESTEEKKKVVEEAFRQYHESAEIDVKLLQDCDIKSEIEDNDKNEISAVVAAGGDGTISSVVKVITGTDLTFGVLPLGTFNNFAKDAGIPTDINEAAKSIINGKAEYVDVAEVNGHIFVNNSSIGFYPLSVIEREKNGKKKGIKKYFAMIYAIVKIFLRYPLYSVVMYTDKGEHNTVTPFVFIGNNRYETGSLRTIGSRTSLERGLLSLYYSRCTTRFCMIKIMILALLNKLENAEEFVEEELKHVKLSSRRRRLFVSLDGEVVIMKPPLDYRIMPKALKLIRP